MSFALAGFIAVYARLDTGLWFTDTATFYVLASPVIAGGAALGSAFRRSERSNRH